MIGAILGVGLANSLMTGVEISKGINVQKAIDIMLSLIVSPLVGLLVAGGLLLLLKKIFCDLEDPQNT